MKRFTEMRNVGRAKYVISYHDGAKKHKDGSPFYDIQIFKNQASKNRFVQSLKAAGYQEA